MRRELVITALLSILLMGGCASKKVETTEIKGGDGIGTHQQGTNTSGLSGTTHSRNYDNVDPYGRDYQGDGSYNQDQGYDASLAGGIKKIYFDVDQYAITPEKLPIVIHDAKILQRAINKGARVKIEGHCDATGSDEYNYALGLRRAKATKDALVVRGVKPSALSIISMGESAPECTTSYSSACFAKNRRVEFRIMQ